MPLLVAVACLAASFLPPTAFALGVGYFLASAAYSIWLKREPMLDIVLLACLFTARIVIGIFAADLVISFWLLTFSMFFFLNLAIVKRYAELLDISREGPGALKRRGYSSADLPLLLGMGSGSAVASASIFVSYLLTEQFPRNIYSTPAFLWLIFPLLLYWASRLAPYGPRSHELRSGALRVARPRLAAAWPHRAPVPGSGLVIAFAKVPSAR